MLACSNQWAKKEKTDKRIPLTHTLRISVIPSIDKTNPRALKNWPSRFHSKNPMLQLYQDIQREFTHKIGLHSPTHRIEIVHQSEKPNYRIQLLFKELKIENSQLTLMAEVRVYHQTSANGDFTIVFSSMGNLDGQSGNIYTWDKAFEQIKARFPHRELLSKLFFSPENRGTI